MHVLSRPLLAVAALCLVFCRLCTAQLDPILVTNQQLGMTFQQPMADLGFYIWTTRLEFAGDVQQTFTDAELVTLAGIAFDSVSSSLPDIKNLGYPYAATPKTVTLLAQGNQLYLASSLKPISQGTFYYHGILPRVLGTNVSYSLNRCQHYNGPSHRPAGHCSEVFLAHMLLKNSPPLGAYQSTELVKNSKVGCSHSIHS